MAQSNEQQSTFSCEMCKKTFTVIYNLDRHIKTVHNKEMSYSCTFCDQSYTTNVNLKKHLKREHVKGEETELSCKVCNKTFARKSYLTKHVMIVHKKVEPISCSECSRSFLFSNHLKRHMVTHHPHSNIKPYTCNLCNQRFADFKVLLRHKIQHSNQIVENNELETMENYYCNLCHSTFILKINLDLHIRRCHNNDAQLHFCELCNFQCDNKDGFNDHTIKHFKRDFFVKIVKSSMKENINVLCCNVCDRAFIDEDKLTKHKMHHIRKRAKVDILKLPTTSLLKHLSYDFSCKFCGETFYNKNLLLSHKFNHLQEIRKQDVEQTIGSLIKKENIGDLKTVTVEEKDDFIHNSMTEDITNALAFEAREASSIPTFAHIDLPLFQTIENSADIQDNIQDTKDNDTSETVSSKDEGVFDLEENIDDIYYDCLSDEDFPFPILELVEDRPEAVNDRLEATSDKQESVNDRLESVEDRLKAASDKLESFEPSNGVKSEYDELGKKESKENTLKESDIKRGKIYNNQFIMNIFHSEFYLFYFLSFIFY